MFLGSYVASTGDSCLLTHACDTFFRQHHTVTFAGRSYGACRLGFGFSAGGLLFPYFVGVASALKDLGVLVPGSTPLAGSSAGAIIAACVSSGMSTDRTMECCLALVQRLREGGTFQKMRGVVHSMLQESLPEDAHKQCSGNTFVNTTRLIPCAHSIPCCLHHQIAPYDET
jgi:hypothetical protein